jgi:hypothetical protein
MGDGIGLLGIAGAQGDAIRALIVTIHFIVARQSVAGSECNERE